MKIYIIQRSKSNTTLRIIFESKENATKFCNLMNNTYDKDTSLIPEKYRYPDFITQYEILSKDPYQVKELVSEDIESIKKLDIGIEDENLLDEFGNFNEDLIYKDEFIKDIINIYSIDLLAKDKNAGNIKFISLDSTQDINNAIFYIDAINDYKKSGIGFIKKFILKICSERVSEIIDFFDKVDNDTINFYIREYVIILNN